MVGSSVAVVVESVTLRPQPSFLGWLIFDILGVSGLMIAIAAVLSFVLTLILARRGRGHLVGAALILIAPLPFVVSLIGALDAVGVACAGLGSGRRLVEIADPIARAMFYPTMGMTGSSPAFILATVNSYWRSTTMTRAES